MTNNLLKVTTLILGLAVALPASGGVVISEVAWMGTADSASAEWIELQNIGSTPVNLEGWTLSATDGSPAMSLSGTLESGAFLILERTSDESLPEVSADIIYTGALGNSGEVLELQDGGGVTIDRLDFDSGWPAGDNDSKHTMQRNDSGWITQSPSPRASVLTITNPEPALTSTSTTPTTTPASTPETPRSLTAAPLVLDMHGDITLPSKVLVGQHFQIMSGLWNGDQHLPYSELAINFGDGTYHQIKITEPLHHRYLAPGTYDVRYELRSQPWRTEPDAAGDASVVVVVPDFWMRHNLTGFILENHADIDLNLSGWVLLDGAHSFRLPPLSYLEAGGELVLSSPNIAIDLQSFAPRQIIDPDGVSYEIQPPKDVIQAVPASTQDSPAAPRSTASAPAASLVAAPNQSPTPIDEAPQKLLLASASEAPVLQNNQAPLWPWFGLGLLLLISLGGFGFILWRQPQLMSSKQPDQPDLFQS